MRVEILIIDTPEVRKVMRSDISGKDFEVKGVKEVRRKIS